MYKELYKDDFFIKISSLDFFHFALLETTQESF